ncbi:isochorismatase family protein [Mycobacterium sp. 4D054]|uniref:isochorismatase family protein n=1 Tax=unclassified Mycobacterium TaxID=2642494 RepID=UPI0021B2FB68|nr:isochorismatase family protein [Mycobacterium sp. SMC-8]UXA12214.1 isochorismatase family protein [Mycobacterium sp. SMC-8]
MTGRYGAATDDTYDQAGFGAAVRRGRRPAILVVDLSRGFTESQFPTGADLTDVVTSTAQLIGSGRAAGVPVVFTTIAYTPAEINGSAVTWLAKATGMRNLRVGSPEAALDPRLPLREEDQQIVKKGASAFFGTPLASFLVAFGCDTVLICGATTSGCVRATAVDAVQTGLSVLVVRECVGDRASGPHEANLFDIQEKYGDVISLDEAIGYLGELPSATTVSPS